MQSEKIGTCLQSNMQTYKEKRQGVIGNGKEGECLQHTLYLKEKLEFEIQKNKMIQF